MLKLARFRFLGIKHRKYFSNISVLILKVSDISLLFMTFSCKGVLFRIDIFEPEHLEPARISVSMDAEGMWCIRRVDVSK